MSDPNGLPPGRPLDTLIRVSTRLGSARGYISHHACAKYHIQEPFKVATDYGVNSILQCYFEKSNFGNQPDHTVFHPCDGSDIM